MKSLFVLTVLFLLLLLASFYFIQASIDNKAVVNVRKLAIGLLFFVASHVFGLYALIELGL